MKQSVAFAAGILLISIGILSHPSKSPDSLLSENVEALLQSELPSNEADCRAKNGYWNMALVCSGGGVESVECTVSGQISILGITFSGSYQAGNTYSIVWEMYSCTNSTGNCCPYAEQGIRVRNE